jgi:DNA mismatch repair protein MutS2
LNNTALILLEFDKVKQRLKSYAVSSMGAALIEEIKPSVDINKIEAWLNETTEARRVIDKTSSIPLYSLNGIDNVMDKIGKTAALPPEDLAKISELLGVTQKIKKFMADKENLAPTISSYALSIFDFEDIKNEIDRCIMNGRIDDKASSVLSRLRKKIGIIEDRIKSKLENIIKSSTQSSYIQEALVSIRNGHYVIPVKKEYKKNVDGEVHDISASGSTIFIEPVEIRKYHDELKLLKIDEQKEEYKILSNLTNLIDENIREINISIEIMAYYDFLFAKGKFSKEIGGNSVSVNKDNYTKIVKGRHPLITKAPVPLDFEIGNGYNALIITGPNTGGKTVTLKTVGLLTIMVQSGLHVGANLGSNFAIYDDILVDIGDGQSIEQSLSTFSSHIRNIISIMECASKDTLVILDELGAGTDPGEGMGIAVSILEEVSAKNATIIATTHYSELKEFAQNKHGFKNGSMDFDLNTLKPLYKLNIGKAGESNAFLIALRLGMNKRIIERAHEVTYKEKKEYKNIEFKLDEVPVEAVKNEEVIKSYTEQTQNTKEKIRAKKKVEKQKIESKFNIGDCVYISTLKRTGIICELENSKGDFVVLVMKNRIVVNKKRLSLYTEAKDLYPENYDFDIIFETKENRKKKHIMDRKYVKGLTIETNKD